MFGTLVICLPSKHIGGAVRLAHGQKEKCFATAESSAYSTTYIAWWVVCYVVLERNFAHARLGTQMSTMK
jgi:hypothetical protein